MEAIRIFLDASTAVLITLTACSAGFFAILLEIFPATFPPQLSAIMYYILSPIFSIVKVGESITLDRLTYWWPLFVFPFVHFAVMFFVGELFFKFLFRRFVAAELRNIMSNTVSSWNAGNLPYVLVAAVASGSQFSKFSGVASEISAIDRSVAYITLYCIPCNILTWTFIYQRMQKPVDMGDSAASSAVDWKRRLKLIFSVPMLGSVAGLAIGLIPFLQKHLLLEPPPILAAAVQSSRILAGCFLGSACVILGASLALTYQNIKSKQKNQLTRQALIMSMIGKLVISPLLSAFVTLLLWEWPFMFPEEARDPLLLFTLLIESAAPCAQSLNMQSMMTGYARDEVSVVILSQYIASIVTMTIWVMAFMSIVPMMSVS